MPIIVIFTWFHFHFLLIFSLFTFTFARLWSQVFEVWTLAQAEMPVIITFTWFHVHFFMVNSFFTFTFARLRSQVWTLALAEMPVIITFTPPSSFILSQPVGTNSKQIQPPVNHSFPQAQTNFNVSTLLNFFDQRRQSLICDSPFGIQSFLVAQTFASKKPTWERSLQNICKSQGNLEILEI